MVSATTFSRLVVLAFVFILRRITRPFNDARRGSEGKWRSGVDPNHRRRQKRRQSRCFSLSAGKYRSGGQGLRKKVSRHSSRHREHARSGDRTAPDGGTARREISLGCLSLWTDDAVYGALPGESSGSDQAGVAAAGGDRRDEMVGRQASIYGSGGESHFCFRRQRRYAESLLQQEPGRPQ